MSDLLKLKKKKKTEMIWWNLLWMCLYLLWSAYTF